MGTVIRVVSPCSSSIACSTAYFIACSISLRTGSYGRDRAARASGGGEIHIFTALISLMISTIFRILLLAIFGILLLVFLDLFPIIVIQVVLLGLRRQLWGRRL